jgi:hypothetical protein
MCLIRSKNHDIPCFRIVHEESLSEVLKHNNHSSVLVSYCKGISLESVKQFVIMNTRFMMQYENSFEITHEFYMSYINYLIKYKGMRDNAIWRNPHYRIKSNNTELFCGINFEIEEPSYISDDESIITHTSETIDNN